ncbi:MAG: hypothetical protein EGQ20_19955 [Bacteroides oleiciplenus]|jgi:hypothetical protein|nr:hypothetical protein [Bacteroides oleiciplenus]
MKVFGYIKQRFSYIGEISDVGASDFAIDFGFETEGEVTDEVKKTIADSINEFVEENILHPTSIGESGFSTSWNADSIKSYSLLMLRKYGITLNDETSALVGLSTIKDASNLW